MQRVAQLVHHHIPLQCLGQHHELKVERYIALAVAATPHALIGAELHRCGFQSRGPLDGGKLLQKLFAETADVGRPETFDARDAHTRRRYRIPRADLDGK